MKIIKFFLPFILLSLFSLCPFLPKQLPAETTPSDAVSINTPEQEVTTPTQILITPTPTITEILPTPTPTTTEMVQTPTLESLFPGNLEEITLENIQYLAVFAEIPYPQIQPDHHISSLSISNDGSKLAIKSQYLENRKNVLVVWDLISNSPLLEIEDSPYLGRTYFSQDDEQLWVFREGFLDQYALQDGVLVNSVAMPKFTESAVAISPDGKYITTGIYDSSTQNSTVHFYELGSFDLYFSASMAYMIVDLRFSPDSKMVAGTSGQIGTDVTTIWDVESGTLLKDFINYYGPSFSSDSTLAAFMKGDQFYILSTKTWNINRSFQNKDTNADHVFILGGNQILALKDYSYVTFIDVNTGEELLELPNQANIINYSPALDIIITNLWGGNIKLWGILQ